MTLRDASHLDSVAFGPDGLVPVVTQDARTGSVLMVAWANREALERTLAEGRMCYWSRSRGELWRKGDTSGNYQTLLSLHADCDADVILALVRPAGPACHTGTATCFETAPVLGQLETVIRQRIDADSGTGYTGRLLGDRNLRLKKLGEEAVELAVACGDGDRARIASEAADLLYHLLVACAAEGVDAPAILDELLVRRAAG